MNYYAAAIQLITTLGRELTEIETRIAMKNPAAFIRGFSKQAKYDVILIHHGPNKISCIKALRSITRLGLKEAKEMSETINAVVISGVDILTAKNVSNQLNACGADTEIKG